MCGVGQSEEKRLLDVHHIIPIMGGGNNDYTMLITLCVSCHQKAEHYTRQFTEPLLVDWTDDELPEGRERWTPPED